MKYHDLYIVTQLIIFVIYFKGINDTAYTLIFAFEINKVSLTELKRNETYLEIQTKINDLVSRRGLDIVVLISPYFNNEHIVF